MKKKDYFIMAILIIIPILCVLFIMQQGYVFGHSIDWLNQHIVIPDYFRQLILDQKTLFSDYASHLNGGVNIYNYSYYGFLRLDVLLSVIMPQISMTTIIIVYSVFLISLGIGCLYSWLRFHHYPRICIVAVVLLYICSSIFFFSHKQIMFVNYMPFLILALYAVDRFMVNQRIGMLVIMIVLIINHSYFYSVSAIVMIGLYYLYLQSKNTGWTIALFKNKTTLKIVFSIIIAIMICSVLLLPTLYVILTNSKSVANTSIQNILSLKLSMNGLLFQRYGCGMTMIAWISLIIMAFDKKEALIARFLIFAFGFSGVAYLFNGTLYVRDKILLVLLPFVLLVIAQALSQIVNKHYLFRYYHIMIFLFPIFFFKKYQILALCEVIIFIIGLFLYYRYLKVHILGFYLIVPCLCCIQNNQSEFLTESAYLKYNQPTRQDVMTQYPIDDHYRFEDLRYPVTRANQIYNLQTYKSTGYTSTNISLYNEFCYDIMKNPVSSVNRVSNLSNANPFFLSMMSVKTISTKDVIPYGYKVQRTYGDEVIATNDNVLPIAYVTDQYISEKDFDQLQYPYTLDTIYNNAIVEDEKNTYQSQIHKTTLNYDDYIMENMNIIEDQENYIIDAKKDAVFTFQTHQAKHLYILSFHVENLTSQDVTITINGITNKLSRPSAPYPNGNDNFEYVISSSDVIENLKINFSKGRYQISDINIYSLDNDVFASRIEQVSPLVQEKTTAHEVLKGTVHHDKDGYFITSLPYQDGYTLYVDGQQRDIDIVNKAFVGVKLEAGKHHIAIEFHAPLKNVGLCISGVGLVTLFVYIYKERKFIYEKTRF